MDLEGIIAPYISNATSYIANTLKQLIGDQEVKDIDRDFLVDTLLEASCTDKYSGGLSELIANQLLCEIHDILRECSDKDLLEFVKTGDSY